MDGENFIMKGCTVCLSNVLGLLMGHKVNRICRAYEKYELYEKKISKNNAREDIALEIQS